MLLFPLRYRQTYRSWFRISKTGSGETNHRWIQNQTQSHFPSSFQMLLFPTARCHTFSSGCGRHFASFFYLLRSTSKEPMLMSKNIFVHCLDPASGSSAAQSSSPVSFLLVWVWSLSAQSIKSTPSPWKTSQGHSCHLAQIIPGPS